MTIKNYINGANCMPSSQDWLDVIDPSTGEIYGQLPVFFNFIIYVGFSYLAVFVGDPVDYYLMNLSMLDHFNALQRGIIDSRDISYFLSVIFLTLYLTKMVLKKK